MIYPTWLDDIEIGRNVFVASAHQDYLLTMITSWRQKTNVEQSYILCQHLNCKMLLNKDENNHCAMLYKHWYICMVLVFKKQMFIKIIKSKKVIMMKICYFYLKDPTTIFWKLSSYLSICQKHSNPRFCDRWWAKMI
jgi:hypothetical protein